MKQPKTAIIAGASGQVGSFLLTELLNSDHYKNIIAFVRKPLNITHPKLQEMIVDFNNPDSLKIQADDVFCCLGTTIKKAGSQEKFKAVDYGFPMALANATYQTGAKNFFVISSMGTDLKSKIFYSRVKAEMERDLQNIGFKSLNIFRPSMLLGPRKEFRFGELIGKFFMQVFAFIIPEKYKGVQAAQVAKSMIRHAEQSKSGVFFIDNQSILKS